MRINTHHQFRVASGNLKRNNINRRPVGGGLTKLPTGKYRPGEVLARYVAQYIIAHQLDSRRSPFRPATANRKTLINVQYIT